MAILDLLLLVTALHFGFWEPITPLSNSAAQDTVTHSHPVQQNTISEDWWRLMLTLAS
jgi:hypothetical protein